MVRFKPKLLHEIEFKVSKQIKYNFALVPSDLWLHFTLYKAACTTFSGMAGYSSTNQPTTTTVLGMHVAKRTSLPQSHLLNKT